MGTTQSAVARLEGGRAKPNLADGRALRQSDRQPRCGQAGTGLCSIACVGYPMTDEFKRKVACVAVEVIRGKKTLLPSERPPAAVTPCMQISASTGAAASCCCPRASLTGRKGLDPPDHRLSSQRPADPYSQHLPPHAGPSCPERRLMPGWTQRRTSNTRASCHDLCWTVHRRRTRLSATVNRPASKGPQRIEPVTGKTSVQQGSPRARP